MKLHPLAKAALFLLGLVLVDQAVGAVLGLVYKETRDGDFSGAMNQSLAHANTDVIVFGSSRAAHHVSSPVLAEELDTSVFNAGIDGQSVLYARVLQALLFERDTSARLFVLQLGVRDMFHPNPARLTVVAPHARGSAEVLDLLQRVDPFIRLKLLSRTYAYNSKLPSIFTNLGEAAPDGWVPLRGNLSDTTRRPQEDPEDAETLEMDALGRDALIAFVEAAVARDVEVFLFCGPRYREGGLSVLAQRSQALYRELALQDGVHFSPVDELTYPELAETSLYRDQGHLNAEGAELFSRLLARELEPVLRVASPSTAPRR